MIQAIRTGEFLTFLHRYGICPMFSLKGFGIKLLIFSVSLKKTWRACWF